MRPKLSSDQWPTEWILLALVLAGVLGYFCWTVLPPSFQILLLTLLIACVPLALLALLLNGIQAGIRDQENVRHHWQHFAEQTNMTFQLQPWRSPLRFFARQQTCECAIKGLYQQRTVTLERVESYIGRHKAYTTQGVISFQNPAHTSFSIKRRGISGLLANLFSADTSAVEQRELETRFAFEGEPASLVERLLQSQSLRKLLLDPFWLTASSITEDGISIAADSLRFCTPACNTEDELRQLLTRLYALTALLEEEMAETSQTN
ncbi:MAG: hypothetical protein NT075_06340 [Chloroflexi bacterium]|nr:hypothetical protein [Chloroflexota bacterium]